MEFDRRSKFTAAKVAKLDPQSKIKLRGEFRVRQKHWTNTVGAQVGNLGRNQVTVRLAELLDSRHKIIMLNNTWTTR
jgi:hypothetical protein